jgi:RNA polymerase subunit RPABC4/transcription elongation factor Spt4
MWVCRKCSEKIEDQFDACWSCGAEKGGNLVQQKNQSKQKKIKSKASQSDHQKESVGKFQEKNPALTSCKDCGSMVSKKADACPSCGAKLGQRKKLFGDLIGGIISLIFLGAIVLAFIGMFSGESKKTEDQLRMELAERCNEASKSTPQGLDKKSFANSCIQGGLIQLKNQGQIK